jgi:hypothetical protein
LDPKGDHSQGNLFLKLFIDYLRLKIQISQNTIVKKEKYIGKINEDYTKGGRIDLFISENKNNEIYIENKIYAEDKKINYSDISNIIKILLLFI